MKATQKDGSYRNIYGVSSNRRAYQKAYYKKLMENATIKPNSTGRAKQNVSGNVQPLKRTSTPLTSEQLYGSANTWNISREVDNNDRRKRRSEMIRKYNYTK